MLIDISTASPPFKVPQEIAKEECLYKSKGESLSDFQGEGFNAATFLWQNRFADSRKYGFLDKISLNSLN